MVAELVPVVMEAGEDGVPQPVVGRFRLDCLTASWWWSSEAYAIHGLPADCVEVTTPLVLSRTHPDDRALVCETMERAGHDGLPFLSRHRAVWPDATERRVLSVGQGVISNGRVIAVDGYITDVTHFLRGEQRERDWAEMEATINHRAVIEQAKGALMSIYAITADEAFALLRAFSNQTNVRVRSLAALLMDGVTQERYAALPPDRRVLEVVEALTSA